jgi:hypothetical protein
MIDQDKLAAAVAPRMAVLPRTVQPWMLFTDGGEMRHAAFSHGGFSDTYHGWTIVYDTMARQYQARHRGRRSEPFAQKSEVYKWARERSLTKAA